jgi:hypothetical protein
VTYDRTHQLLTADRPGTSSDESHAYDPAGNRISGNGATYGNAGNNRLSTDGAGYTYVYHDEGNISHRYLASNPNASTYYGYDHRNRLTAVSDFNANGWSVRNVAYSYDASRLPVSPSPSPPLPARCPIDNCATHGV